MLAGLGFEVQEKRRRPAMGGDREQAELKVGVPREPLDGEPWTGAARVEQQRRTLPDLGKL